MMKRLLVSVCGSLALASGVAASAADAPAVSEGYDWAMRVNDEERTQSAILAYEVADTDDQPLALSCEEGGNRIFASISGGDPELTTIELVSGGERVQIRGTTDVEEMPYFSSTDEIAADSPFIRAFAANGWLRMTDRNGTIGMAATPPGKQAIARFIAFCAG